MDRLGGQVSRELKRFAPAEGDLVAIVRAWPEAVGDAVARKAWPARIARDGTLLVHTVSSTWAFELGRLAPTIVEQLRAAVGEDAPATLRFVPGPVPDPPAEAAETRVPEPPSVGSEDAAEGARLAASIEDPELRELVSRAAAASLARARADRRF